MNSKFLWAAGALAAGVTLGVLGAAAGCAMKKRSECPEEQSGRRDGRKGALRAFFYVPRSEKNTMAQVIKNECGFCGKD